jgi:Zn-dependent M28 family amino/carboxypeptidase
VIWGIPLRRSANLIATSPFGSEDRILILGAHLDTVYGTAGLNDNGTGVVAAIGLAQAMSERQREPDHQARVVLFTREEDSRLGSYTYAQSMSEAEAEATAAMLNLDMLGSPNGFPYIMDGFELGGSLGEASDELTTLLVQALNEDEQPWDLFDPNIYSDHVFFIDREIPIAYLATGGSALKTEEQAAAYGGTAGQPYDPNYHTPEDDLDNVDQELLGVMTRAAAGFAQELLYLEP